MLAYIKTSHNDFTPAFKFLYVTVVYRGGKCFTIYLKTKENKGKRQEPWSKDKNTKLKTGRGENKCLGICFANIVVVH